MKSVAPSKIPGAIQMKMKRENQREWSENGARKDGPSSSTPANRLKNGGSNSSSRPESMIEKSVEEESTPEFEKAPSENSHQKNVVVVVDNPGRQQHSEESKVGIKQKLEQKSKVKGEKAKLDPTKVARVGGSFLHAKRVDEVRRKTEEEAANRQEEDQRFQFTEQELEKRKEQLKFMRNEEASTDEDFGPKPGERGYKGLGFGGSNRLPSDKTPKPPIVVRQRTPNATPPPSPPSRTRFNRLPVFSMNGNESKESTEKAEQNSTTMKPARKRWWRRLFTGCCPTGIPGKSWIIPRLNRRPKQNAETNMRLEMGYKSIG